jgi:hypothetical protein
MITNHTFQHDHTREYHLANFSKKASTDSFLLNRYYLDLINAKIRMSDTTDHEFAQYAEQLYQSVTGYQQHIDDNIQILIGYARLINGSDTSDKSLLRMIPGPDDLDGFIYFLQSYSKIAKTESMSQWISKQHDGAIPPQIKQSFRGMLHS